MRGPIRSVLLAVSAVAGCLLAFGAGSAAAVNVLTASGGAQTGSLRDNLTTPPSSGGYGADLLASNTAGSLSWTTAPTETVSAKTPQFDVSLGLKLSSNPVSSKTTCSAATGYIQFADFQNMTQGTGSTPSPVYADTLTPWRVTINSADTTGCTGGAANNVTISNVHMYAPTLSDEYTGTIIGLYEHPGANCAAGGVKLNLKDPGLLVNGVNVEAGFDNGVAGKIAFLCFTSSNNYVYPSAPKAPGALTGSITAN